LLAQIPPVEDLGIERIDRHELRQLGPALNGRPQRQRFRRPGRREGIVDRFGRLFRRRGGRRLGELEPDRLHGARSNNRLNVRVDRRRNRRPGPIAQGLDPLR